MQFFESLGDGWTIYLWLIIGAMIIVACVYWIRWAAKNEQFDEDIKYLVFDEGDQEKMSPQEYAKSREVLATQEQSRVRVLRQQEEEHTRQNEAR
jgi:cbb3-type cytochrome oxidase subunit 3